MVHDATATAAGWLRRHKWGQILYEFAFLSCYQLSYLVSLLLIEVKLLPVTSCFFFRQIVYFGRLCGVFLRIWAYKDTTVKLVNIR